jgi:hypothetical protein
MYQATVIRIMLASPGDVIAERSLAREVVHEWNSVHSEYSGLVLMPKAWDSDSTPTMGDRPQAIINKQILKSCDLLVAIFWTRLGSPTGTAPSGTVEEIREHLAAGKPAIIYFSDAPVVPSSVDLNQYEAVKQFKAEVAPTGLLGSFQNASDFRVKFSVHLAKTIIEKFNPKEIAPVSLTAGLPEHPLPNLSAEAKELIVAISKSPQGVLMKLGTFSGTIISANQKNYTAGADARTIAKWSAAVGQLEEEGLIEDRAGKGEVFFINNRGYEVADQLQTP